MRTIEPSTAILLQLDKKLYFPLPMAITVSDYSKKNRRYYQTKKLHYYAIERII